MDGVAARGLVNGRGPRRSRGRDEVGTCSDGTRPDSPCRRNPKDRQKATTRTPYQPERARAETGMAHGREDSARHWSASSPDQGMRRPDSTEYIRKFFKLLPDEICKTGLSIRLEDRGLDLKAAGFVEIFPHRGYDLRLGNRLRRKSRHR